MSYTTKSNGDILNASDTNSLAEYHDSQTDNTESSDTSGNWVSGTAFTGLKALSADASVVGVFVKLDIKYTNVADASYAVKITGTNLGTVYPKPPFTQTIPINSDTKHVDTVRQVLVSTNSTSFVTAEIYVPIPLNVITGDATYDVDVEMTSSGSSRTAHIKNVTVQLDSVDNVIAVP